MDQKPGNAVRWLGQLTKPAVTVIMMSINVQSGAAAPALRFNCFLYLLNVYNCDRRFKKYDINKINHVVQNLESPHVHRLQTSFQDQVAERRVQPVKRIWAEITQTVALNFPSCQNLDPQIFLSPPAHRFVGACHVTNFVSVISRDAETRQTRPASAAIFGV